ncbi:YdbH domain-containing protein [Sphingomonas oligoaromativorans]|uniref:YdbH domain-containing protein n=1 Tax=Sphingomonas oligoaromativorans TaxID=575322 RepID=UPI0014211D5C|nr:YdbH domain-containing protein [Sphingomonas oligoaromativorans]NIJ32583.1 hypothetical protein [Sphingomonas oligoaromativorans]
MQEDGFSLGVCVEEGEEGRGPASRRIVRGAALAGGVTLAALLAGWIERRPIVEHFVGRTLSEARVPASYRIVSIGPFEQRLEAVRIGDPVRPDLVAKSVVLTLGYGLGGPYVKAVQADGVRLAARIVDGRLSLGAIDRLLPKPSGNAPAALPDMAVSLHDGRVTLDTPAGRVTGTLEGSGLLSDGFSGSIRLGAPGLKAGGCAIRGASGRLLLETRAGQPHLSGPLDIEGVDCPENALRIGAGRTTLDVRLARTLDRGRGGIALAGFGGGMAAGRFASASGLVTFSGDARELVGTAGLNLDGLGSPAGHAAKGMIGGAFRLAPGAGAISFAGDLALRDAALAPERRRALLAAADMPAGSPVTPIARRAAGAVDRMLASTDVDARIALTLGGRTGNMIEVQRLTATGRRGGFVRVERGGGFGWRAADKAWRLDGRVTTGGGDLPALDILVSQPRAGAALTGEARLTPYRADKAQLAMTPLRFGWTDAGLRISTVMTLDGPVASGRIEGLTLPITGRVDRRGGVAIDEGCVPLGFRSLTMSGVRLDPAHVVLCGTGGALVKRPAGGALRFGAVATHVRLGGHSGASPLSVTAGRVELARTGLAVRGLAVRLGAGEAMARLDAEAITGAFDHGRFEGASAAIAHVPLDLTDLAGTWRIAGGGLDLKGGLSLSDATTPARFAPLSAQDAQLRVADGRIEARAALREPRRGTAIASVSIVHALSTGTGHALIDVPGISFTPKQLQPEALTPLTLGVIANVSGTVAGQGRIDWNGKGVTSGGRFHTEGLDLAAAFGPVSKIAGTIEFSDLLGLATPPGQDVRIAEVNPGVAVSNGIVHYQLLGGQRVAVEDARWPFAGGELVLDPTVLDFDQRAERHLTFRVKGLDAAAFVQQLAFPNISATGTFDGVLPMLFDQSGGRIVGGELVARKGGGSLAYVGELTNAELGMAGKLAFDALKKIRYQALSIGLDGKLDGEIVSRVNFDGVRQDTGDTTMAARLIRNLPFRFNIQIRAPFRGLMGSARAFVDPSILLNNGAPVAIQPAESETMR